LDGLIHGVGTGHISKASLCVQSFRPEVKRRLPLVRKEGKADLARSVLDQRLLVKRSGTGQTKERENLDRNEVLERL
jgi:hypothetical protein